MTETRFTSCPPSRHGRVEVAHTPARREGRNYFRSRDYGRGFGLIVNVTPGIEHQCPLHHFVRKDTRTEPKWEVRDSYPCGSVIESVFGVTPETCASIYGRSGCSEPYLGLSGMGQFLEATSIPCQSGHYSSGRGQRIGSIPVRGSSELGCASIPSPLIGGSIV